MNIRNRRRPALWLALAAVALPVVAASSSALAAAGTFANTADAEITNPANWSGGVVPAFGTTIGESGRNRWDVNGTTTYTAAQGDTVLDVSPSGGQRRGLVLSLADTATSSLTMTGGSITILRELSTANPPDADYQRTVLVGAGSTTNFSGSGSLIVTGGTFDASSGTDVPGGEIAILFRGTSSARGTLTVGGTGTVIADIVSFGASANSNGTGTINLNAGGTLVARTILDRNAVLNSSVNFDGGTLRSRDNDHAEEWIRDDAGGVAVNILAGGAFLDTNGQDGQRITATVGGVGALTKLGAGTLILEANNTYAGGTVISEGTLRVGNGGGTGSIAAGTPVTNNGTLVISRSGAFTFSNPISGTGAVRFAGPAGSVTTLTGAHTYAGATTLASGRLDLAGSVTSDLTVAAGADLGGEGSTTGSITFEGASTLYFDPGSPAALKANFVNASGGTVMLKLSAATAGGTGIVVLDAPGGIAGTAGAGGNFQFSGRGATYLNPGATKLLFDYTPAALKWTGTDPSSPAVWDVEGTANWSNAGSPDRFFAGDFVTFDASAAAAGGTTSIFIPVESVAPGGVTVNNDASSPYTFAGGAIAGVGKLTKDGAAGTLIVTNDNTYSGGTEVKAGTVQLGDGSGAAGRLGTGPVINDAAILLNFGAAATVPNDISGAGSITQSGSATASLTGNNTYAGTTTVNAGTTLQVGNGGTTGTLGTGAVINEGTLVFNRGGTAATVPMPITTATIGGSGTVQKTGGGAVVLAGNNTYAGETTIAAGALVAGSSTALGSTSAGTVVSAGATLGLADGVAYPAGEALTISGTGRDALDVFFPGSFHQRGALQGVTGSSTWAGDVLVGANDTRIGVQNGASIEISGNVTELNGNTRVILRGSTDLPGGILLSGTGNNWTGGTDVFGSTIKVGADNALGGATAGLLRVGTASVGVTKLDLNGFDQVATGLALVGGLPTDAIVTNAGSSDSTLTLDVSAANQHFQGLVADGPTHKLHIVKSGSAQQAFSGDNTYTGTTTIAGGILQVGAAGTTGSLGTGPVVNDALLRFNRSNAHAFLNPISGSGAVEQNGTNVVTLGSSNTYQGLTTVTRGAVLVTANSNVLGDATFGTVVVGTDSGTEGASVGLSGGISYDPQERLTIQGAGVGSNIFGAGTANQRGALQSVSGDNTWAGPIEVKGAGARIGTQNGAGLTVSGTITGDPGSTVLFRVGSGGVVTISGGVNTWGTTTTFGDQDNTGTLRLGITDAFPASAPLNVGAGKLDLNGFSQTAASLANGSFGPAGASAAVITNDSALAGSTSVLTSNAAGEFTLSVPIADGAGGGKVAFVMGGTGVQTLGGASTYSGTTTVNAGTLRVTGSVANSDVTVNAGGTFEAAATQTITSLTLNYGAAAAVGGTGTVLTTGPLVLDGAPDAWNARLDLRDNDLIIRDGSLETVLDQVEQGRNGGAWNGTAGITSSVASGITGLAVILNTDDGATPLMTEFGGQPVDETSVLLKYTYNGDANVDGRIDAADYYLIDKGHATQVVGVAPTYRQGDFNYDGLVDATDYLLIDAAFLGQTSVLAGGAATSSLRSAGATAVPEPAAMTTLALAAGIGLLGRRRGRRDR